MISGDDQDKCIKGLVIRNLSDKTSEKDIIKTLGVDNTPFLEAICSCKIGKDLQYGVNSTRRYAIVTAPTFIANELIKLNGIEVNGNIISVESTPLQFYELMISAIHTEKVAEKQLLTSKNILEFVFNEYPTSLSNCVILSSNQNKESTTHIHAAIATVLQSDEKSNDVKDIIERISNNRYYELLSQKYTHDQLRANAVKKKTVVVKNHPKDNSDDAKSPRKVFVSEDESDVAQLTQEIRQYNMNVCKQMKRKLQFLDRKNFKIRNDRGSTAHEQIYIDCSTNL